MVSKTFSYWIGLNLIWAVAVLFVFLLALAFFSPAPVKAPETQQDLFFQKVNTYLDWGSFGLTLNNLAPFFWAIAVGGEIFLFLVAAAFAAKR